MASAPCAPSKPVEKGTVIAIRRFPLLGKTVALGAVVLALMLALQSVSGIVVEREGRLRDGERSVAASLASAQTLVGPVIARDCGESREVTEGEGKDRKTVTERRDYTLSASGSIRATSASSRSTAPC